MKIKATINIHRDSNHMVRIQVEDTVSRTRLLDLLLTPEAFGNAVTGLSHQLAEGDYYKDHPIGLLVENKDEIVEWPSSDSFGLLGNKEAAVAAMKKFEVDGWHGNDGDLFNGHRAVGQPSGSYDLHRQRVTFTRYVDPDTKQLV